MTHARHNQHLVWSSVTGPRNALIITSSSGMVMLVCLISSRLSGSCASPPASGSSPPADASSSSSLRPRRRLWPPCGLPRGLPRGLSAGCRLPRSRLLGLGSAASCTGAVTIILTPCCSLALLSSLRDRFMSSPKLGGAEDRGSGTSCGSRAIVSGYLVHNYLRIFSK